MKKTVIRLGLPTLIIIGLGVVLFRIAEHRPRPIFTSVGATIEYVRFQHSGQICIGLESAGKTGKDSRYFEALIEPDSGSIISERRLNRSEWMPDEILRAKANTGWSVVLPSPVGAGGDRVIVSPEGDSSENWLRLISPNGQVQALKKLPTFSQLSDLKFTPDGSEILALKVNTLWRYNVRTGEVKRVVRPGAGTLTPDTDWPKNTQEVWTNDAQWNNQDGAVLTPDGKYIVGFHSNITADAYEFTEIIDATRYFSTLVVYDSRTGQITRRVPMPFPPKIGQFEPRPFKARCTSDGQYLLVEGPHWDKVLCIQWKDGKQIGVFDWEQKPYTWGVERQPPILSPDGRYFCEADGADIVLRSVLDGSIMRRARGALGAPTQSASDLSPLQPLAPKLAVAPDISAIYLRPFRIDERGNRFIARQVWRWPLDAE